MTAVIGILNKGGVALAADSAVTISGGNGRKIYNSAYKIFALSKYHPVGIMIYNSASLSGIPWEIIIKEYRKKINQKSFARLSSYRDDFIQYLKKEINLVSKKKQDDTFQGYIDFIFHRILNDVIELNKIDIESLKTNKEKLSLIKSKLIEQIPIGLKEVKSKDTLVDFADYTLDNFLNTHKEHLDKTFNKYFSQLALTKAVKLKLLTLCYFFICKEYYFGSWTGLVFAGYGDKEIYPSCLPIKVGEVVDKKIRYSYDNGSEAIISDMNSGSIAPFAQRDVIDTILSGIDRTLENTIYTSFSDFLSGLFDLVKDKIGAGNEDLIKKIEAIKIDKLVGDYSRDFQELKRKIHIQPLMSSISSLSKEDLAELAESLIYLTYLKRRMSFSEESVGGPIDVAIITKGDGLIWIKRKHYFDKELNQDFIFKYLK